MAPTEKFKDWQFRYQYVYGKRRSEKSKKRFIGALLTDLVALGVTPQVIEFDRQKKQAARNIYVGNLQTAKKVICTYYDTPPNFFGNYVFFNQQLQARKTIRYIIVTSALTFLLGLAGLVFCMRNNIFAFDFSQPKTYFGMLAILLFFSVLGNVSKGLSSRRNLVRNTSTLLLMLTLIEKNKDADTAYAFVDEGSFGERGLEVLKTAVGKQTAIFFLDSVGANTPLFCKGKKTACFSKSFIKESSNARINYIFSGEVQDSTYYLSKNLLKSKEVNLENLNLLVDAFS